MASAAEARARGAREARWGEAAPAEHLGQTRRRLKGGHEARCSRKPSTQEGCSRKPSTQEEQSFDQEEQLCACICSAFITARSMAVARVHESRDARTHGQGRSVAASKSAAACASPPSPSPQSPSFATCALTFLAAAFAMCTVAQIDLVSGMPESVSAREVRWSNWSRSQYAIYRNLDTKAPTISHASVSIICEGRCGAATDTALQQQQLEDEGFSQGVQCGNPSSSSSTPAATVATQQSSSFVCSCHRSFDSDKALFHHRRKTGHAGGTNQLPTAANVVSTPPQLTDAEQAKRDKAVSRIKQCHIDQCAEARFEHCVSNANVQRQKEATQQLVGEMATAVKRTLEGRVKDGVNLDALIDPIMSALEDVKSSKAEASMRQGLLSHNVVPRRRSLGEGIGEDGRPCELFMYDVPLEQSLQREYMHNPSFASYMTDWAERPPNPDGLYTSTQDGSVARNHPALSEPNYDGPPRLGFAHYYDDVEVVNPLGAARTKHKVGLHYVQLLNAPPHIRSELDVIFLVGVVLVHTQDQAGIATVLQGKADEAADGTSFGASLRRFDQPGGISFRTPAGGLTPFRGWLILVAADALAAAELLGMKKSFGPKVKGFCWQCHATTTQDTHCVSSFIDPAHSVFEARTQESYISDRRRAKRMRTEERKEHMSDWGIKTYLHAFTRIPYFRALQYIPRDLMHVELEGNLKVHLHAFLYTAVKKNKWFTLAGLNAQIRDFHFASGKRRPPPIPKRALKGAKGKRPSPKGSIPYTSGHMLQFTLHSLEIMRPLLSPAARQSAEFRAWEAHVQYFSAMMRSEFTDDSIAALDALIREAQQQFLNIAAYSKLWKPKNHFAQHIPADIKLFGPPRTYWCMRFEAKNQDHKRAAKTSNFFNVPKTIADFWGERSALRLRRKRKREQTCITGDGITHCGMHFEMGTWILFCRPGEASKLAQINSIAAQSDQMGQFVMYVTSLPMSEALKLDDNGEWAAAHNVLEADGVLERVTLEEASFTALVAVEFEGVLRFVEQP